MCSLTDFMCALSSGATGGGGGSTGGSNDNALYPVYGGAGGGYSGSLTTRQASPLVDSSRSGVGGWEAEAHNSDRTGVGGWVMGGDEAEIGARSSLSYQRQHNGHSLSLSGVSTSVANSPSTSRTMGGRGNRLAPLNRPPALWGGAGAEGFGEEETFGAAMANARKLYAREKQR